MTDKEVMQLALDALENHTGNYKLSGKECDSHDAAVEALRSALAAPVMPLTAPVTDDEIDTALRIATTGGDIIGTKEMRRAPECFAAGRRSNSVPMTEPEMANMIACMGMYRGDWEMAIIRATEKHHRIGL